MGGGEYINFTSGVCYSLYRRVVCSFLFLVCCLGEQPFNHLSRHGTGCGVAVTPGTVQWWPGTLGSYFLVGLGEGFVTGARATGTAGAPVADATVSLFSVFVSTSGGSLGSGELTPDVTNVTGAGMGSSTTAHSAPGVDTPVVITPRQLIPKGTTTGV